MPARSAHHKRRTAGKRRADRHRSTETERRYDQWHNPVEDRSAIVVAQHDGSRGADRGGAYRYASKQHEAPVFGPSQ